MAKLNTATILTAYPLRSGNPVASVVNDSSSRPTTIVYNVTGGTGTETVSITYATNGDPIFKSVTYPGHSLNIFEATLTTSTKSGSGTPELNNFQLFNAIPTTGTKTDSIAALGVGATVFFIVATGGTTSATITVESTVDGTNWDPLDSTTLTIDTNTPIDAIVVFNSPFTSLRVSFDTIVTGGDTFEIKVNSVGGI